MSIDYNFTNCEVRIKFSSKEEMDKKVKDFERECAEYTEDSIYVPAYVYQTEEDKKELKGCVVVNESEYVEVDELANLICKHFPNSTGAIGWSYAEESAGGYVRCAGGGRLEIKDGKVVPSEYEQIKELKEDLYELLDYVGEVVSNGDITECGVAHLFKKYMNEEYKECLRNKED